MVGVSVMVKVWLGLGFGTGGDVRDVDFRGGEQTSLGMSRGPMSYKCPVTVQSHCERRGLIRRLSTSLI